MEPIQSLGFGTASLSSMRSHFEAIRLLNTAYKEGIRHFDTAPLYGRGYAEKLVGLFAKDKRANLLITTKFGLGNPTQTGIPPYLALPLNYYRKKLSGKKTIQTEPSSKVEPAELPFRSISLSNLKNSLEGSLNRLQTKYIDFYLLHEALPEFLEPDAFDYLLSLKQNGIVRYIGLATNANHLQLMSPTDCQYWDILQYEAGPLHELLKNKYPGKLHFLHSALKNIGTWQENPEISITDRGGYLLAHYSKMNGSGKLLFSTRRRTVLRNNLLAFNKFSV